MLAGPGPAIACTGYAGAVYYAAAALEEAGVGWAGSSSFTSSTVAPVLVYSSSELLGCASVEAAGGWAGAALAALAASASAFCLF